MKKITLLIVCLVAINVQAQTIKSGLGTLSSTNSVGAACPVFTEDGIVVAEDAASITYTVEVDENTTDTFIHLKVTHDSKWKNDSEAPAISDWANKLTGDANLTLVGLDKNNTNLNACDGSSGNKVLLLVFEYTGTYSNTLDTSYTFSVLKNDDTTDTVIINILGNPNLSASYFENINFQLSPNPASDMVNLSAASNIENATLYNIAGQELSVSTFDSRNASLDISQLSKGLYVLKVSIDGHTNTYKLIKK